MRINRAIELFSEVETFSLLDFARLSKSTNTSAAVTLHRWTVEDKIIPLKRGLYTLSHKLRHRKLSSEKIANLLREPSYLSSVWALSYHEAIMESVFTFTSVSPWPKSNYVNAFGRYEYQQLKETLFFGYARSNDGVLIASPEKALLDYLYLSRRTWSWEEIEAELRLKPDILNNEKMMTLAAIYKSLSLEKMARLISTHLTKENSEWSTL